MTTATRPNRTLTLTDNLLTVTVNGDVRMYWLKEVQTPAGGRVFEVARFGADEPYFVRLDRDGSTCTCKAGQYRGKCVHQDALARLVELEMV